MATPTLVVLDRDTVRRKQVIHACRRGVTVHECANAGGLGKLLGGGRPCVVLIGSMLNGSTEALAAAYRVRSLNSAAHVVMIADQSSETIVVGALKAGVADYLRPPITIAAVMTAIDRFLFTSPENSEGSSVELIGGSAAMRALKESILQFAPMECTVLITGETGTGKEVVAQFLHRASRRATKPLVCVNCAAIPDTLLESDLFGHESGAFTGAIKRQHGQIEMAERGTLFLDEIGEMSLMAQAKLLRVIEQREVRPLGMSTARPVDVRLIAATQRDLERMIGVERFRRDLFYRINVARLHIPPLRERMEDVPALANHFLAEFGSCKARRVTGFTNAALRRLMEHAWPGNVRELRNAIETAAVVCQSDVIGEDDLRAFRSSVMSTPAAMEKASSSVFPTVPPGPEIERLMQALRATNWNVTRTARMLHWSRMTVYRKVAKYGMGRPPHEEDPQGGTGGATPMAAHAV